MERCNFTNCRYNVNGECTSAEERLECVSVAEMVLCINDDEKIEVTE